MRAIVTVKLKRYPIHDPRNKIVGPCPLGGRTSKCTDVTGSHHSYIEVGKDLDDIYARAKRKYGHVTRVEVLKNDEIYLAMERFRTSLEKTAEYAADQDDLLEEVQKVLDDMSYWLLEIGCSPADYIKDWRRDLWDIMERRPGTWRTKNARLIKS